MEHSISRRRFLAQGAPVLAAVVVPGALNAAPAWAKPKRKDYYVLEPEHGTGRRCSVSESRKPEGCHGCTACHKHAANKLFATRKAAADGRAHPGCKCKVVHGGKLDVQTWSDLFGGESSPKRLVVDRRSKHAKAAFNRRARRRARRRNRRR